MPSLRSTVSPASRATCGQFQASIAPGMNQSTRWWFTESAHATYDVQLHAYMPQRSTTSASPAPGQRSPYGYPYTMGRVTSPAAALACWGLACAPDVDTAPTASTTST